MSGDSTRRPTVQELAHDRLADRMESLVSHYDTARRVEVLVDDLLGAERLAGKRVLDVGCGVGFFSERLVHHGAHVTACDLGEHLVEATRRRVGCEARVADALELASTFGNEQFDVVVSSECIEHTPDPARAIDQMLRVLKPGGYLSLSTPNLLWQPIVRAATKAGLRPFDGHENFMSWRGIRKVVAAGGGVIREERGLHLFPFQLGMHPLSRALDRAQALRGLMINACVLAQKTNPRGTRD